MLASYPDLAADDIDQALHYAAETVLLGHVPE